MPIKIDRKVPMPPVQARGGKIYPWDELKVGDSFVVNKGTNGRQLCIQASGTRAPKKFESRIIDGVCRVWRTA